MLETRVAEPVAAVAISAERDEWRFFLLGVVMAGLAIVFGAFAAHAIKGHVPADRYDDFLTGARYHLPQALALFAVSRAAVRWPHPAVRLAGWLFVGGIVLFCGSLYLLGATGQRWLGAITPIGGLAFIVGWGALAWAVWSGRTPAGVRTTG